LPAVFERSNERFEITGHMGGLPDR